MSAQNNGGAAFPVTEQNGANFGDCGMSLRDYFAAKAPVNGEIAIESAKKLTGRPPPNDFVENIVYWNEVDAKIRYMWADAMLAVREAK
jgi:hypothetical protein